jgi:hypothetical protein
MTLEHTQSRDGSRMKEDNKQYTFTVDSFGNGIAFGQHQLQEGQDPRDYYGLHLKEDQEMIPLRSRYALHPKNPLQELEVHMQRLSRQGILRRSTIYFGVTTDPFYPFDGKFDASMRFLEIFQRYVPGQLVVQTRSPLLVIAMPIFTRLKQHAAVTIGIETPDENMVERYTPGLPRVEERLKTATALRRFGVEVTLQVSPLLPYGDWRKDAAGFAELLARHGDYVTVRPLSDGSGQRERLIKKTNMYTKIAEERKFHYLRPDAANPLITALEAIAPDKLKIPERPHLKCRQMKMFAA